MVSQPRDDLHAAVRPRPGFALPHVTWFLHSDHRHSSLALPSLIRDIRQNILHVHRDGLQCFLLLDTLWCLFRHAPRRAQSHLRHVNNIKLECEV